MSQDHWLAERPDRDTRASVKRVRHSSNLVRASVPRALWLSFILASSEPGVHSLRRSRASLTIQTNHQQADRRSCSFPHLHLHLLHLLDHLLSSTTINLLVLSRPSISRLLPLARTPRHALSCSRSPHTVSDTAHALLHPTRSLKRIPCSVSTSCLVLPPTLSTMPPHASTATHNHRNSFYTRSRQDSAGSNSSASSHRGGVKMSRKPSLEPASGTPAALQQARILAASQELARQEQAGGSSSSTSSSASSSSFSTAVGTQAKASTQARAAQSHRAILLEDEYHAETVKHMFSMEVSTPIAMIRTVQSSRLLLDIRHKHYHSLS